MRSEVAEPDAPHLDAVAGDPRRRRLVGHHEDSLRRTRQRRGDEAADPARPNDGNPIHAAGAYAASLHAVRIDLREAENLTYSIVARDPETGQLGVAVQSHWFGVGPIVPWALPRIGAVATQANAEVSYGPRALELMEQGVAAPEALAQLLADDPGAAGRQVAVLDSAGRVAVHTGEACIPFAGHATGDGVSCQANIMASERVWPAMLEGYRAAAGSLTTRLLAALDAAEAAGGDIRGRQSAAILVVPAEGKRWETVVSLHVEDHPEPLAELRRLVGLHDAYVLAGEADELVNQGRHGEAAKLYREAGALAPDNHELRFWAGLGAAQAGDLDTALAQVRAAIEEHPPWRELLARLSPDVAPAAPDVLRAIDHKSG
jgi:uncharacterized Ntn-hydrolase superfamily protein